MLAIQSIAVMGIGLVLESFKVPNKVRINNLNLIDILSAFGGNEERDCISFLGVYVIWLFE